MESNLVEQQFEPFKRCLRVKEPIIYDEDDKIDDELEGRRTFAVEDKLVNEKFSYKLSDFLLELNGSDFDLSYIQQYGFSTPILFKCKEGLGLKMPDPELFSVNDVKSYVGPRRVIEVFDCDTHEPGQMTVHNWIRYYTGTKRDKILNVTSLEFSQTGLQRIVECPSVVHEHLDWVPLVWPKDLYNEQKDTTNTMDNMKYPKVRNYVLMSVAGCYTDFHIDFGGTSVWYHVLKGGKVFWLVPPTERNLAIYEEWMLSGRQSDIFFGDLVSECYRVNLVGGDTFMIPSGWIHGVYTPIDSLVFGGNFLHSYNIKLQLRVYDIEDNTHIPRKLRYPFFIEIHWYMIKTYVDVLERDLDERRLMEFEALEAGAFRVMNNEINNVKDEKVKSNWHGVHLTLNELEGLKHVCKRFRNWTHAKMNYPSDIKEDSMELIDRLEELLQHHEDDDQILACRGVNFFKQLNTERTASHISALNTPLNKPDLPSSIYDDVINVGLNKRDYSSSNSLSDSKSKNLVRRVRCDNCEGCKTIENCNRCKFCLDKPRNGGEGKLKKSCQMKYCKNPQLSKEIECKICEKSGNDNSSLVLMECCVCNDIVHQSCTDTTKLFTLSKISNCWECPDCYENRNKLNSDTAIKVKEKIQNGHINIQNLKNLIQSKSNKFKFNGKNEEEKHNESSEDEPLINKRRFIVDNKDLTEEILTDIETKEINFFLGANDRPNSDENSCDIISKPITDDQHHIITSKSIIIETSDDENSDKEPLVNKKKSSEFLSKETIFDKTFTEEECSSNDSLGSSYSSQFPKLEILQSFDDMKPSFPNIHEQEKNCEYPHCSRKKSQNNIYETNIKRRASYSHDKQPSFKKRISSSDNERLVHKKIFYNTDHAPNVKNTVYDEPLYKRNTSYSEEDDFHCKTNESSSSDDEEILKLKLLGDKSQFEQSKKTFSSNHSHHNSLSKRSTTLPKTIWEEVFSYLSSEERRKCNLVCRSWNRWYHCNY